MIYNNDTTNVKMELIREIESEKKFLTFRKLLKIIELNAMFNG